MKTVLITGAAHGIGRSIAEAFAAEHDNLHLICHTAQDELEDYAERLSFKYHVQCTADAVDVSDHDAVEQYYNDRIHSLDLLINNAGISYIGLLQDMTPAEWNNVIATNLSSVFYMSKHAIPLFLKNSAGNPGAVINVTSVWGQIGASNEAAYSASKGGVDSLTKALAKELSPNGIPVNAISCGCIDTRMNNCFDELEKEELAGEIPAGRFASPDEVASAVLKLSQMPPYMTGQIIRFDGGWV